MVSTPSSANTWMIISAPDIRCPAKGCLVFSGCTFIKLLLDKDSTMVSSLFDLNGSKTALRMSHGRSVESTPVHAAFQLEGVAGPACAAPEGLGRKAIISLKRLPTTSTECF